MVKCCFPPSCRILGFVIISHSVYGKEFFDEKGEEKNFVYLTQ